MNNQARNENTRNTPLGQASERLVPQVVFNDNPRLHCRRSLCGRNQQEESGPALETIGLGGDAAGGVDGFLRAHVVVCCVGVVCCVLCAVSCVFEFERGPLVGTGGVCGGTAKITAK